MRCHKLLLPMAWFSTPQTEQGAQKLAAVVPYMGVGAGLSPSALFLQV